MKPRDYLYDKRFFIVFYIILMTFITLVISLDISYRVTPANIIYLNIVGFIFFLLYLIIGYFYHRRYYLQLQDILRSQNNDFLHYIPDALTKEQKIYNKLLEKIYVEQNLVLEKLTQERRENKEFVTSWFHAIKTPIAVLRLMIENSREKTKETIVENLAEEIDKIELQVEQALYYARADSFASDYFIGEVKLAGVVKRVVKKYARAFIDKKISLQLQELETEVSTDKKWLSFILDQIIANSLKYTEPGGRIVIRSKNDRKEKRLVITDNGMGIKQEDLARVFEMGFTGYLGRREQKATGIGLYLARKLARRLGHEITIESSYGEYTTVVIHFPRLADYYNLNEG